MFHDSSCPNGPSRACIIRAQRLLIEAVERLPEMAEKALDVASVAVPLMALGYVLGHMAAAGWLG